MPALFRFDAMLKAQQWERTKGELRALVAMQGSYSSGGVETEELRRWQALDACVEAFIKAVDDEGLAE